MSSRRSGGVFQAAQAVLDQRVQRVALGAAADDIELARYEPDAVRPAADWLEHRRALVARMEALGTPLLLATETGSGVSDDIVRRIDRLANGEAGEAPSARPLAEPDPLHALVEESLRCLENVAAAARRHDEAAHATA